MASGSSYLSNTVNVNGTSAAAATTIMAFTIPSAGTWAVEYFVTMSGQYPGYAGLFTNSDSLLTYSEISGAQGFNLSRTTATGRFLITTSGSATYKLKGWSIGQYTSYQAISGSNGRTGVVYIDSSGGGSQGVPGPVGATGPAGATGAVGARGATGLQGIQGITGERGIPGQTGPQGLQGNTGAAGLPGLRGDPGAKGDPGAPGQLGPIGLTGSAGKDGTNGSQGLTGAPGAPGAKGDTGKSITVYFRTTTPTNQDTGSEGDVWYQTY